MLLFFNIKNDTESWLVEDIVLSICNGRSVWKGTLGVVKVVLGGAVFVGYLQIIYCLKHNM